MTLRVLFEIFFPTPKYMTEERMRALAQDVVSRQMSVDRLCGDCEASFSAAGTDRFIREGRYLLEDDIQKMKERALSYSFL